MRYVAYIFSILPAWVLAIVWSLKTYDTQHYYGIAIGLPIATCIYTFIMTLLWM